MFHYEYRTVKTREITYSQEEMRFMRLRIIYNAEGDFNYLNREFMENIYLESIQKGEAGLIEVKRKGRRGVILSILVFEDVWSRNIYALKHREVYDGSPEIISLMN